VAEIAIHIDGEPYTLLSPHEPGSEFSAFSSEVLIGDPGSHVISVVSFDTQGSPSEPVKIPVAITGAGEMITIQDTSEPLGTPMETLEIKRTEPPPAATATGTATIIKVPTSTTKPEDKQPPEIRNVSHTPQEIWNYHTCGAVEFDIRAQISDLSGIKKATVTLRVVKDGSTGEWVTANMNPFGDWYHATVGTDLLKASMDSYRGTVEYYLSAVDEMGNRAESPVRTLPVKDCLI